MRLDGRINTRAGVVRAPGLELRGQVQSGRVRAGINEGSIDPSEAAWLGKAQHHLANELTAYKANDGKVGPMERRNLHRDLNQISSKIFEFRHDRDPGGPCANAPKPGAPSAPTPRPGGPCPPTPKPGGSADKSLGEKESFQASITGDPHFSVEGSINGEDVSSKFDNQDIGTRTQYKGAGFELQTTTTEWGGNEGTAVVDSATVNTGFGRNTRSVTVNSDGSVYVGKNQVNLEEGESSQLNRTSTLTHNEDGTWTVSSRNGKVTNTFDAVENENGNYLNIQSSVDDVQTVGWLQNQV